MSTITKDPAREPGAAQNGTNGSGSGDKAVAAARPAKDPRITALKMFATSITVFTTVGLWLLGFEDSYIQPIVAVLCAYAFDLTFEGLSAWQQRRKPAYAGGRRNLFHFLLPAHITGMSLALLLYPADRIKPIIFAVAAAQTSKYIFTIYIKGRKKHYLNPSNFGVTVTLLAFPSVGIAFPYQFTENISHNFVAWILPLIVLVAGTTLNVRLTKKWPLIIGWVGGFILQALVRAAIFDQVLIAMLLPLTGLVFWLFTNYMITDPGTTPIKPRNQVVFGFTTAILYGVITAAHIVFGIFYALTIVCCLRAIVICMPNWRAALASRLARSRAIAPAVAESEMAS